MSEEQTFIDFPVGDDPDDPSVIPYWEEVIRRLRVAKLLDDLEGWAEALQDRIDTFRLADREYAVANERYQAARKARLQDAARFQELEEAFLEKAGARSSAASEFGTVKRKLSRQFLEHYDLGGPIVRALFTPRGLALVRN